MQGKLIHLAESLSELQSNHYYNLFIPLISQATKCKILISNFNYPKPEYSIPQLEKALETNVSSFYLIMDLLLILRQQNS